MDLAFHHLAQSTHADDVRHAERVNEYRRIADEQRPAARPVREVVEPRPHPVWSRLVNALAVNQMRFHRHAH
ncbi:hypothetical protein BCL57_001587 [Agromyces flavus]|uniref:Uncharacterized protein n=1 Tax=Agromyces flavus TaxID=589382 RepID=A0A1H2A530_9MICO|nr:hypothetical protein [Agromyces flavus]MCP2367433.1 hypothetical protein [Agromyces flavus]GGI45740.1 hypothetical protein GCM10010932_11070 [Agromyces flavus]SDT40977.1 hypothetical protein SAMN04489721_3511 [Agromyces flavus]